jgi:hypothetical protein
MGKTAGKKVFLEIKKEKTLPSRFLNSFNIP